LFLASLTVGIDHPDLNLTSIHGVSPLSHRQTSSCFLQRRHQKCTRQSNTACVP
jgi:hypothetical protein